MEFITSQGSTSGIWKVVLQCGLLTQGGSVLFGFGVGVGHIIFVKS